MSGTPASSARSAFVLDASAAVRLLLYASERVQACLREGPVVAPSLMVAEVTNALVTSVRTGRITANRAEQALTDLLDLDIEFVSMTDEPALVLGLAVELGLSGYDSFYLALAASRDARLVTADRRLAAVAPRSELVE